MATGGLNQTATPSPVVDFTPNKDYLSFSGMINEYFTPALYANAGANNLLVSDVLGGLIIHTAAAAQTDTLPSAAALVPYIQGAQGPLPGIVPPVTGAGSGLRFFVRAGGAGAITLAVGAGGTLVGTGLVATMTMVQFLLVVTSNDPINPTYTVYQIV